jgi:hypothetical protein
MAKARGWMYIGINRAIKALSSSLLRGLQFKRHFTELPYVFGLNFRSTHMIFKKLLKEGNKDTRVCT